MEQNIFTTFSPKLLSIPDSDTLLIKTHRYWHGSPDFVTYEQAFVYFYNLSQQQQNHEAILSNALSLNQNRELRDKYLNKYLANNQIQHREFAHALLVDSLYSLLDTSHLVVLYDFNAMIKLSKEELQVTRQLSDTSDIINDILYEAIKEFPGRKAIHMKEIALIQSSDARFLSHLFKFSIINMVSVGEIELVLLDPEIWEQFRKQKVSSIDFVNCLYYDKGGLRRNAESYHQMIDEGLTPLFYPPERQRFMQIQLSSLILTRTGRTKKYYYDTTTFGNVKVGVSEVAKEIAEMLRKLEKKETGNYYLVH